MQEIRIKNNVLKSQALFFQLLGLSNLLGVSKVSKVFSNDDSCSPHMHLELPHIRIYEKSASACR